MKKSMMKGGLFYIMGRNVLKVIGSVLTITSMAAMGFYFSSILRTRAEELLELKKYFMILKGEIRYHRTPLPEAMGELAARSSIGFQSFFQSVHENLKALSGQTFYQVWARSVEECLGDTCLSKEDKASLKRFGENLGFLDQEMQINTIDLYLSQLEEQRKRLTIEMKDRTRIYNLLGIAAGIFITIIML